MIECIEMRGIKSEFLKAIATVRIPSMGIICRDVKLFKKGERYWVSLPTKEYEKEGKKHYYQFMQFIEKEKGEKLLEEIKDCLLKNIDVGNQFNDQNRMIKAHPEPDLVWDF
ncbi:MAG TPA: hypothetical protein VMR37_04295 [Rhabdochlamydiaceae bacterium]|nr:hypothetical protein [Rhabdochlamydiaceae bacterium]